MGSRHTRSFWEALLVELKRGESIDAIARRHQVRPRTLAWWRWHLGRESRRSRRSGAPRLLPVVVRDAPPIVERAALEIAIDVADVRVHCQAGADVGYVAALVGALRRSC